MKVACFHRTIQPPEPSGAGFSFPASHTGIATNIYLFYANPAVSTDQSTRTSTWDGTFVSNFYAITNHTAYDALGRLTAGSQITYQQTYPFLYSYNLAGALTGEQYPSARVVTTSYDSANRAYALAGLLAGAQTSYNTQTAYWPSGAVSNYWYGSNVVPVYTYNTRLQPNQIYATIGNSSNSFLTVLSYNWGTTSNNGTLQSGSEGAGAAVPYSSLSFLSQRYSYDAVNRLSGMSNTGGYSRSFGYDARGACTGEGCERHSGVGDDADHRLKFYRR